MTTDQTEYELFVSYARKDNRPLPETYPQGWVSALKDFILADHRQYSTAPLRIFFDTDEIRDMDDWRNRILGGLRRSKVLLVCLSPSYFASEPCKWEWDEYQARQALKLIGSESHATVYFVEVPGSDEQDNAARLDAIMGKNFTDLRPWFPTGTAALQEEAVRQRLGLLGQSLWQRIDRARRALDVPGNVRSMTPYFVGRTRELVDLHRLVGVGKIGLVTAVHGLGGQGKTELAVAYARGYADCYRLGLWSLEAEGKNQLLPLIGELAFVPEFGYTPSDAERNDADALGRGVLLELSRRAESAKREDPTTAPATLLILDNVSEAELLAPTQLSQLPSLDCLRIITTTRLDPKPIDPMGKKIGSVMVDSLDADNALRLIREHLPGEQFASAQDESDAKEIVHELGGFTLAVEQVAVFLGLSAHTGEPISPGDYLARLRAEGLPSTDALVDADTADQIEHQHKQLAPILKSMLRPLTDAGRTLLKYASLLPPERIPWPWLRELTLTRHPELAERKPGYRDPWLTLRRQVEGLRFLTGSPEQESARMHRLIAAHLRTEAEDELDEELRAFVAKRADVVYQQQTTPADWELDGLLEAIPHLLVAHHEHQLTVDGMFLADKVLAYRNIPTACELLDSTHTVIQALAESDPGNAEWQRDLSVSLNKLGNVAVAQGKLPQAETHYAESVDLRRRLADSDPGNAGWQRDLSVSLNKLGNVAVAQGKLPQAETHYAEYHGIARRLAESDPGNAGWQRDLSVSLDKLGNVAVAQGKLPQAETHYVESLDLRRRLAESDPGNAGWQRDLSVSLEKLGDVAVAQGKLPQAETHYVESLDLRRRLADSDPGNAGWQRDLSVSLNKLGDVAVAQGKLPQAEIHYAEYHVIALRLAESDPGNAGWQRDLSVSLDKLGDVAVAQGKLPQAETHYAEYHGIARRLADSDPGNAGWQRDLSVSLNKLGDVAVAQGKLPQAEIHYAEYHVIALRLAESDPGNAGWQRDLSVSLDKLGDVAVAQGKLPQAETHYAEYHGIARRLAESDPGNAGWQRDLSVSLNKLGDVAVAQGKLPQAETHYVESLDLRRRLADSDPGNAGWQRDLSVSLNKLGDVAVAQGKLPQAETHYAESLDLRRRLADSDPGNAGWQRDLSVSLNKLGDVAVAQGKLPQAETHYVESLDLRRRLVDSDPGNAGWQRDLFVSHAKIASLLERQNDPQAMQSWRSAHDVLAAILAKGLHVSPKDLDALKWLEQKLSE